MNYLNWNAKRPPGARAGGTFRIGALLAAAILDKTGSRRDLVVKANPSCVGLVGEPLNSLDSMLLSVGFHRFY